jgi:hypothetical protein
MYVQHDSFTVWYAMVYFPTIPERPVERITSFDASFLHEIEYN